MAIKLDYKAFNSPTHWDTGVGQLLAIADIETVSLRFIVNQMLKITGLETLDEVKAQVKAYPTMVKELELRDRIKETMSRPSMYSERNW
jgi:hypothetical protein